MYVIFGIGQGFQPVAGYNYGANNKERVVSSLRYTMFITVAFSVISCLILIVFGRAILSIFRPSNLVMDYGLSGLKLYAFGMILMAVTNTIGVFYQALGKGKESLILSISRQGLIFIPVILLLPQAFGTMGIISAQLVADILTLIVTLFMFMPFLSTFKKDLVTGGVEV